MKFYLRGFLSVVLAMCLSGMAFASGFSIYEWSSTGDAMGGATIAGGEGAEVLPSNPAAITRVDDSDWDVGVTWISPSGQVRFYGGSVPDGIVQYNEKDPAFVPHAYYVKRLSDNSWFGFGSYSRFGLSSKFAPDWEGRYNSYYTAVESISFVPTYAVKVNDSFSVAVGIEAMYLDFENRKKVFTPAGDVDADVHADNWGWGWNLGLLWDVTEETSLGAVYHSRVEQSVKGKAVFKDVAAPLQAAGFFPNTSAWGTVTLPDSLSFGLSHRLNDKTRLEIDAVHTWWSTYDSLIVNYGQELVPGMPGSDVTPAQKDWKNVWRYQLGVEHKVSDRWTLMAGFVYDCSPIPDGKVDFMVPAGDRQIYSLGTTYENRGLSITLSYAWLTMDGRNVSYESHDPETGVINEDATGKLENLDSDIIGLTFNLKL